MIPGDKPVHTPLDELELYAWVGADELGSGAIGLKQGDVPAGRIALVATAREKIEPLWPQMEKQAARWGKRIHLVKFRFIEVVRETKAGE